MPHYLVEVTVFGTDGSSGKFIVQKVNHSDILTNFFEKFSVFAKQPYPTSEYRILPKQLADLYIEDLRNFKLSDRDKKNLSKIESRLIEVEFKDY